MSRLRKFAERVNILDLSRYTPGPIATLFLADMGAKVTKIEAPQGDDLRNLYPRGNRDTSLQYEVINACKSLVHIDLRDSAGQQKFLELAASADVIVNSFRPGFMEGLGLGYKTLAANNPGLIFCTLSGFGGGSPLASMPAHDLNFLALSGILYRNGEKAPEGYDPPMTNVVTSLFATQTILGALNGRHADGLGCEIEISMADVLMAIQGGTIAEVADANCEPSPGGKDKLTAYSNIYATADGRHVAIQPTETKFWSNFCLAAERPDWVDRKREAAPQHALVKEVRAFFASMSLDECMRRFDGVECCLTPVLTISEALAHPHHKSKDIVRSTGAGTQALYPALIDGEAPPQRAELEIKE